MHRTFITSISSPGVSVPEYDIPLFDLSFGEAEEQAVAETVRSRWISMGARTSHPFASNL